MPNFITSEQTKIDENAIYYFQKKIRVSKLLKSTIHIAAESRYKLYINGEMVSVGPCKRACETVYYDTVDITKYLVEGENTLNVTVLQLCGKQYDHAPIFLDSLFRDGNMTLCVWGNAGDAFVATDETWRVAKEKAITFFCTPIYHFYNVASLAEKVNASYKQNLDFHPAKMLHEIFRYDEAEGTCYGAIVSAEKRPIPLMYLKQRDFIGKKKHIYDAGALTCGFVRLRCKGQGRVRITYAECMVFIENGEVRKRKRDDENGVIIGNYDTLEIDGECFFEPFWMRTFRYIEVIPEGDIEIVSFDYLETGYPLTVSDTYDFGNAKDNQLFAISVNTLQRCMHETYMDCPYYEQFQYAMDTHLQMLFTYQLTLDKALAEKAMTILQKAIVLAA